MLGISTLIFGIAINAEAVFRERRGMNNQENLPEGFIRINGYEPFIEKSEDLRRNALLAYAARHSLTLTEVRKTLDQIQIASMQRELKQESHRFGWLSRLILRQKIKSLQSRAKRIDSDARST